MKTFNVWYTIKDQYRVVVKAESLEQALDMVLENPESEFDGPRIWSGADIEIDDAWKVEDEEV